MRNTHPLRPARTPSQVAELAGLTVHDAALIAAAMDAELADCTRIQYASVWRQRGRWCLTRVVTALSAPPEAIAAFLVGRSETGVAYRSIELGCSAIKYHYQRRCDDDRFGRRTDQERVPDGDVERWAATEEFTAIEVLSHHGPQMPSASCPTIVRFGAKRRCRLIAAGSGPTWTTLRGDLPWPPSIGHDRVPVAVHRWCLCRGWLRRMDEAGPAKASAEPRPGLVAGGDPPVDGQVWAQPLAEVIGALGSTTSGLTDEEAASALQHFGPNVLDVHRRTSGWKLLGRQFLSPILLILLGATILSGLLGDLVDASIIVTIIALSGLLGFWQERSAGRAMATLLQQVEAHTTVLRDGQPATVPMSAVVPGDVVQVSAGDLVPGDCVVIIARDLMIDESVLTGETFPVQKSPGLVAHTAPLAGRTNMSFLGTHVSSGSGSLLVVGTGQRTEIGAVAHSLAAARVSTGFEIGMTSFGLLLTRIMVVLVVGIFAINLLLDRSFIDSALFSLALAVGLTPQLLPAIVSISLAQGARAIARERVIVRRLDAIEDFGSMDVFCSDKTGTMTQGRVELTSAIGVDGESDATVERLAHVNAALQIGLRNAIDEAIVAASLSDIHDVVKLDELPYDFNRKRLSVLVQDSALGTDPVLITKGAFDSVLDVCTDVVDRTGSTAPLATSRDEIQRQFTTLSSQGSRVLAVARRTMKGAAVTAADESGMSLVGLLVFTDPVKPDAADILDQLAASGISVRMLTGDNHLVAAHVSGAVGLDATASMTGTEVDRLDDRALDAATSDVMMFSELNPLHKERIVRSLRRSGAVVGYLGDGINDVPALQAADVGISVDTAVAVAKQSAAIVLLDKDLKVVLAGVYQGRRTFANTMKYIFMTTSANFGNMLSMAVASAVLPFLPLLAGQILLINLLTDLPGTTIATDSVDDAQLAHPQRWNVRLIRNYLLVFGTLSSVFDLITFAVLRWGYQAGAPEFRSAWFLGSIITEVGVLFALRTRQPFYRSRPSPWVAWSSVLVVLVAVALPFTPLAEALELVRIPATLFLIIVALAVAYLVSTELVKRPFWHRRSPDVGSPPRVLSHTTDG